MRLPIFVLAGTLLSSSVALQAATYDITFTGGFYLSPESPVTPFAPDSGTFSYDSGSGFSNFLVQYYGQTFDLTASANAPQLCDSAGLNCSVGDAAAAFALLTENSSWFSYESFSGSNVVTNLVLAPYGDSTVGPVSAFGPGFNGFEPGQSDLLRSGFFSLTETSGGGGTTGGGGSTGGGSGTSATPEPGSALLLSISGLIGLLSAVKYRRRRA